MLGSRWNPYTEELNARKLKFQAEERETKTEFAPSNFKAPAVHPTNYMLNGVCRYEIYVGLLNGVRITKFEMWDPHRK